MHSKVHRITFPLLFQWFLCTVQAKRPRLGCIESAARTDRPDLGDRIEKGWPTVSREPEFCAAMASFGAKRRKRLDGRRILKSLFAPEGGRVICAIGSTRLGKDVASMTTSDPQYGLDVSRADLAQALKIVARAIGKDPGDASFRFEGGRLSIEANNTAADTPARGTWPRPIFVSTWWVRRLARRMPVGDPIHLRVDAGRLYANRYSEPCAWTVRKQQSPDGARTRDEQRMILKDSLILEAARILKPLRVEILAVESLVSEALERGTSSWSRGILAWSEEEKKMGTLIEKAWMTLAPFGVGMPDIHRLVDKTIRDAWKTDQEK